MRSLRQLFRIVALAVILSLLAIAIPATPVLAYDYDIYLDPDEGEIGDYFYVEGDDWPPSQWTDEPYTTSEIDIYFSRDVADESDRIDTHVENYEKLKTGYNVDEDGEFRVRVKVPDELTDGDEDEDVRGGTYYVSVTRGGSKIIRAVAKFTVIAAEIVLDPDEGTVGTEVEITGIDFAGREYISIEYNGDEADIESGDDETDRSGEFICTIIIPESTAGVHPIMVTDESGNEAEADFAVESEITVTPATAVPGDAATVSGTGFGKRVDVTIKFGGDEVATGATDTYGSFQTSFEVPAEAPGSYTVEARDEDRNRDTLDFTIAAGINLSPTTGHVGIEIAVNGAGFTPNSPVTITYAPEAGPVATVTTDNTGRFAATFKVPESRFGAHTVTATDGTGRAATDTFTMESTSPPVPQPQLPLDGDKAKSTALFEWGDVSDPSGVTYDLQIASDDKFTRDSIVLEKTGLAKSEYTLTKDEKLDSTRKEAPYYWRVRAADGAENTGSWTTPGAFYVGFTFELTGWVLYVLLAIAGLLLLAIGFWVGRRTSYF